jgi:hypothetical protein
MLLARIYEAFPLCCSFCHAEMRIIAFITEPSTVRTMLDHLGEATCIACSEWSVSGLDSTTSCRSAGGRPGIRAFSASWR